MLLQNIFSEIEQLDPEVYERLNSRRNMFRFGAKVAAAAVPMAFGASLKSAYGQGTSGIVDVLNFALTLEYLERDFYYRGLETVIPGAQRIAFHEIWMHENAHVNFLRSAITSLGGTPVSNLKFDFTAKGAFPTVFSNFEVFKTVSQAFEDTGVRAYKGQAGNLMSAKPILQAALQIHSVEARHAAAIRKMRNVSPWVSFADGEGAPAAIYAGENMLIQGTSNPINVSSVSVAFGVDDKAVSESFDEPLSKEQVLAIVTPFLA
ncbi:ferritin-like domain-containing protein [Tellurirhabdus bombi]|uniref:ferritin-like domain-containing protein n=1 Tax=Tellurirhabdus bombi TaxID=2907205 RepID=UPI001F22C91F|nr:ferritin-like domain-containing protein [Tellurirhabdus bombi]